MSCDLKARVANPSSVVGTVDRQVSQARTVSDAEAVDGVGDLVILATEQHVVVVALAPNVPGVVSRSLTSPSQSSSPRRMTVSAASSPGTTSTVESVGRKV